MSRDPMTHAHALFLQAEAAKRGVWDFPCLADAETLQTEPEPVESWLVSAAAASVFAAVVAVLFFIVSFLGSR